MKFTLVFLLAACVFAAQGLPTDNDTEHKNGIYDKAEEIIVAIIVKIEHQIYAAIVRADKIYAKLLQQLDEIVQSTKALIGNAVDKLLDDLEKIAEEDEKASACVEVQRSEIKKIGEEYVADLDNCQSTALFDSMYILSDIRNQTDKVKGNIQALKNVLVNCLEEKSNPITVTICVVNKAFEIKDQSFDLIKNTYVAVKAFEHKTIDIVKEFTKCTQNTVKAAFGKAQTIREELRKCAAA